MKFYIGAKMKNLDLVNYLGRKLEEIGWEHTYNWAKNLKDNETFDDMLEYSILEKKAIQDSDVVIILLPAGKATHVELGMALALNKQIYLWSRDKDEFSLQNAVSFYELPGITKIIGTEDEIIKELTQERKKYEKNSHIRKF